MVEQFVHFLRRLRKLSYNSNVAQFVSNISVCNKNEENLCIAIVLSSNSLKLVKDPLTLQSEDRKILDGIFSRRNLLKLIEFSRLFDIKNKEHNFSKDTGITGLCNLDYQQYFFGDCGNLDEIDFSDDEKSEPLYKCLDACLDKLMFPVEKATKHSEANKLRAFNQIMFMLLCLELPPYIVPPLFFRAKNMGLSFNPYAHSACFFVPKHSGDWSDCIKKLKKECLPTAIRDSEKNGKFFMPLLKYERHKFHDNKTHVTESIKHYSSRTTWGPMHYDSEKRASWWKHNYPNPINFSAPARSGEDELKELLNRLPDLNL